MVFVLPFLQRLLYLGRLYYGRDFTEVIGARGYFYHQLRQGKLILWDSLQAAGIPFPSYLTDLFNPFSLAYTFLLQDGYLRSYPAQWLLTVHCSFGALGAYLLGLSLNLGRTAAVVMGVIMGCCGVVTIKSVEPMMIHTFAWAPWVFLFLHRARERKSMAGSLWAGVFLGLCFMGGHPQIFYYIGVAVLLLALYRLVVDMERSGARTAWSGAWRLYLPLTLSFLLTGFPQWAHQAVAGLWGPPGIHTGQDNRTLLVFSQDGSADFSLLFNFLFPALEGGHSETYFYVGIMPLVLAWVTVLYTRRFSGAGFWKVLVLVSLVLMMGGNFGIHKILVDILPGFKYFRLPSRWVFLVHFGLLVLSGYGVARILSVGSSGEFGYFTKGLSVIIGGLFLMMASLAVVRHLGLIPDTIEAKVMFHSVTGVLLFISATWFVFRRVREGETGPGLRVFIIAVVILDLAFYHPSVGVNLNTAWSLHDFGRDPSEVTSAMDHKARGMAALSGGTPTRFFMDTTLARTPWKNDISQSALYRYRVGSFMPIDGYPGRLHPYWYWELIHHLTDIPRGMDLLGAQFLEMGQEMVKARRSKFDLTGGSQAGLRLDPASDVSRLALEITGDQTRKADPRAMVAEVALVESNRLIGNWPITGEQLSQGGIIELPLRGSLRATEVLMASTRSAGRIRIERVLVNGNPVSDTVQTAPGNDWLARNGNAQPLAFFVSRGAVVEDPADFFTALASLDPSRCVLFQKAPPGYQPPEGVTVDPGDRWRSESGKWKKCSFK